MTRLNLLHGVTRRHVLATGVGMSSLAMFGGQAALAETPKVSQACVHFKQVAEDEKVCGNCRLFESPAACKVVAGEVTKHCTCRIWLPRIG